MSFKDDQLRMNRQSLLEYEDEQQYEYILEEVLEGNLKIMLPRERKALKNLPAIVTLYRGGERETCHLGTSWSLSREVALAFAQLDKDGEHRDHPAVCTGTCRRKDIKAYIEHDLYTTTDRGEQEVIIENHDVRDLSVEEVRG